VARLAEQFVCVRLQSMNGKNINLFQFDYDLTWMAFFMDAHDRFYARYGGREDSSPESYLTKASLLKVMREVQTLHRAGQVQTSRYEPTAKTVRTPEDIPLLSARIMARKPDQRCIHCHDVKQGVLQELQAAGKFSKDLIFGYPVPSTVGLQIDPNDQKRVQSVKPRSPAAQAGLRSGDVIEMVDGQHILSVADFARVLELTPKEATLPMNVQRSGEAVQASLKLAGDWRRSPDPSWRSSTYVAGPNAGFWGIPLNEEEKRKAQIPPGRLALRVSFLFKDHPTPRKAGLQLNDIIIDVEGIKEPLTPRQLHTHCQMNHNYGDQVPITVLRGGKEIKLVLEMPDKPPEL
jgi:predicted metalloprotease with PDZ domain